MLFDFFTLESLRKNHPSWKLLLADSAPMVIRFLYEVFVETNNREISQTELESRLEDVLYTIRETMGPEAFPRKPTTYLDEWADDEHGWLRKYYPPGIDEPYYDLTANAEKAIRWLESLGARQFVGTESRLLTIFDLLKQMVEGHELDPELRIIELERRKAEIEREIERVRGGDVPVLDDLQLRDRFQQLVATARELLADFREVEQNFRHLDRVTRQRITLWEGSKAELLEQVFGESEAIEGSDQGRSFQAFWDFLMASDRQEEFSLLLEKIFQMDAIMSMGPDHRLKRMHHDWLDAGEHTQRTLALLSEQLRRFLDDHVRLENRRIREILRQIESSALVVADDMPRDPGFMTLAASSPDIELPMERGMYVAIKRPLVDSDSLVVGQEDVDVALLFSQFMIDKELLRDHIRGLLAVNSQVTLVEVLAEYPLEKGLAELMTYMAIASEWPQAIFLEDETDVVDVSLSEEVSRYATIPRIIFNR